MLLYGFCYLQSNCTLQSKKSLDTVVGGYIYKMKTTFDFVFDLYQAFKQLGYTKAWEQREAFNKKVLFIISL